MFKSLCKFKAYLLQFQLISILLDFVLWILTLSHTSAHTLAPWSTDQCLSCSSPSCSSSWGQPIQQRPAGGREPVRTPGNRLARLRFGNWDYIAYVIMYEWVRIELWKYLLRALEILNEWAFSRLVLLLIDFVIAFLERFLDSKDGTNKVLLLQSIKALAFISAFKTLISSISLWRS